MASSNRHTICHSENNEKEDESDECNDEKQEAHMTITYKAIIAAAGARSPPLFTAAAPQPRALLGLGQLVWDMASNTDQER